MNCFRTLLRALAVLAVLALGACSSSHPTASDGGTPVEDDPCAMTDCPAGQLCVVTAAGAASCVPESTGPSPCEGNPCDEGFTCVDPGCDADIPACRAYCDPDDPSPCARLRCREGQECVLAEGGTARCEPTEPPPCETQTCPEGSFCANQTRCSNPSEECSLTAECITIAGADCSDLDCSPFEQCRMVADDDCPGDAPCPRCVWDERFAVCGDLECPQGEHCEPALQGDAVPSWFISPGVCIPDILPEGPDLYPCRNVICAAEEYCQNSDDPSCDGPSLDCPSIAVCVPYPTVPEPGTCAGVECSAGWHCELHRDDLAWLLISPTGGLVPVCVRDEPIDTCADTNCPSGQHCEQTILLCESADAPEGGGIPPEWLPEVGPRCLFGPTCVRDCTIEEDVDVFDRSACGPLTSPPPTICGDDLSPRAECTIRPMIGGCGWNYFCPGEQCGGCEQPDDATCSDPNVEPGVCRRTAAGGCLWEPNPACQ